MYTSTSLALHIKTNMQDIRPPRRTAPRGTVRSDSRERLVVRTVVSRSQVINYGYTPSEPEVAQVVHIEPATDTQAVVNLDEIFNTISMLESQPALRAPHLRRPLAHAAVKADIVERAVMAQAGHLARAIVEPVKAPKWFAPKRMVFGALAVIVLATTGYISFDTWKTNTDVKAEFSKAVSSNPVAEEHQAAEGKDESEPTHQTLAAYVVSPDMPRAIYINKIKVSARVLPMAVNKDGSMQAPRNIFDAGWYTGSVKPGDIGAMFVDGHASGPTREGLFAYLDKLVDGDVIEIEKGDGSRISYRVVHTEVIPLDGLDMKRMLLPYGTSLRGLNLMTCTGKWLEDKQTFDSRVAVFAEQI